MAKIPYFEAFIGEFPSVEEGTIAAGQIAVQLKALTFLSSDTDDEHTANDFELLTEAEGTDYDTFEDLDVWKKHAKEGMVVFAASFYCDATPTETISVESDFYVFFHVSSDQIYLKSSES